MNVELKKEEVSKEAYVAPALTKHDALHALTGASGVQTPPPA